MNRYFVRALLSVLVCVGWVAINANAQNSAADVHVAKAKAAAYMPGHDISDTFDAMCTPFKPGAGQISGAPSPVPTPPRSKEPWGWAAMPVKVFDNLYYVGNSNLNNPTRRRTNREKIWSRRTG
jgi:hypothetical protein